MCCHGMSRASFPGRYTALLDRLDTVPMAELVMAIRRTSPGFTRGSSSFRGVTQHKSGASPSTRTALPSRRDQGCMIELDVKEFQHACSHVQS